MSAYNLSLLKYTDNMSSLTLSAIKFPLGPVSILLQIFCNFKQILFCATLQYLYKCSGRVIKKMSKYLKNDEHVELTLIGTLCLANEQDFNNW